MLSLKVKRNLSADKSFFSIHWFRSATSWPAHGWDGQRTQQEWNNQYPKHSARIPAGVTRYRQRSYRSYQPRKSMFWTVYKVSWVIAKIKIFSGITRSSVAWWFCYVGVAQVHYCQKKVAALSQEFRRQKDAVVKAGSTVILTLLRDNEQTRWKAVYNC